MEDPFSNASNEGKYRVLQLINKDCLNHMAWPTHTFSLF